MSLRRIIPSCYILEIYRLCRKKRSDSFRSNTIYSALKPKGMSLAKCRRHFPLWRQAVCHQRSNKKIQMGPKTKLLNTGVITRSLLLLPPPPPPPPSFFLFLFYFKQIFLFDFLPYTFFFSLSLLLLSSYLSACVCVCVRWALPFLKEHEKILYMFDGADNSVSSDTGQQHLWTSTWSKVAL